MRGDGRGWVFSSLDGQQASLCRSVRHVSDTAHGSRKPALPGLRPSAGQGLASLLGEASPGQSREGGSWPC